MSDGDEEILYPSRMRSLAESISEHPPMVDDDEDMEAILIKWVLVCEWADTEGNVWLTRRWGNGHGGTLATWDMKGMLHEALHGERW